MGGRDGGRDSCKICGHHSAAQTDPQLLLHHTSAGDTIEGSVQLPKHVAYHLTSKQRSCMHATRGSFLRTKPLLPCTHTLCRPASSCSAFLQSYTWPSCKHVHYCSAGNTLLS